MLNGKPNPLLTKSFSFALEIIQISQKLQLGSNFVFVNQLLKSGTSIGANIREAQACESKADFVHKLKISAKEIQETEYWLLLINASGILKVEQKTFDDLLEIQKIISKSIATVKNKLLQQNLKQ